MQRLKLSMQRTASWFSSNWFALTTMSWPAWMYRPVWALYVMIESLTRGSS